MPIRHVRLIAVMEIVKYSSLHYKFIIRWLGTPPAWHLLCPIESVAVANKVTAITVGICMYGQIKKSKGKSAREYNMFVAEN